MGGGIFRGYKPGVEKFYSIYKELVQKYGNSPGIAEQNILAGEQILMYHVCDTFSDLSCLIVNAAKMFGPAGKVDDYFYMLPLLNQKDYEVLKGRGMMSNFTLS